MSEGHAATMAEPTWQGGGSPFAVGHKKLGMWLFIVSDTLTFSALLLAYSFARAANDWPTPFHFMPSIVFSTVMTLVLLTSSLTMVYAVSAAHHDARRKAVKYLLLTGALGLIFVILHSYEWIHLMRDEGMYPWSNPYGTPLFGATFFGITGLHMFHVLTGVIYLVVVARGYWRGKWLPEDVEVAGLYWHFVDLVWMFVFPMIYLLSTAVD
ncbi:MAG: cytochrome c oxidase subunit 3 [Bryobacterales bacterium]|nr:cytochrome c oxidase subunit 3 [Bryobacterales bacterium]